MAGHGEVSAHVLFHRPRKHSAILARTVISKHSAILPRTFRDSGKERENEKKVRHFGRCFDFV